MYAAALIDHHPLLRLGLGRILSRVPGIREVHGYAPDQVSLADSRGEDMLPVQILLFGESGDAYYDQALLRRAVEWLRPRQILVLTEGECDSALAHERIHGCVRKTASPELIESAVRLVLAGGSCFPARQAEPQDDAEGGAPAAEPPLLAPHAVRWPPENEGDKTRVRAASAGQLRITPRQFEILALRAQGMSLKKVARTLGIAEATVKAHASAMYRRLNVTNQIEAARLAAELGVQLPLMPEDELRHRAEGAEPGAPSRGA